MKTRHCIVLFLLFCLGVALAPAARAADTGAHAYVIIEKDVATSILTEPVRGRETGAMGPNACVLATGETRQADDGQMWMEITQPALGWIPARNAGEPSTTCEAAYQVLDALYEILHATGGGACVWGEYKSLGQVPEIRDWVKAHAHAVIEYDAWRKDSPIEGKPLDQAMDDIMAMFEYLPANRPDCSDVPREEFFDYFPAIITDEPDTFYFMMRENLRGIFRTLHFKITPDGPVVSAVVSENRL
jgi:hypothetical protein